MPNDTNAERVKQILGRNYDSCAELAPFVETANAVGDAVVAKGVADGYTYTAASTRLMKSWLGAYYYTRMDPTYKSKSTMRASGSFNSSPDDFLRGASDLDPSGWLEAVVTNKVAGLFWGGKTATERLDWVDRN